MNIIEKIKNYWKNRNIYSLPKGKEKPNRQTKGDKSDRNWILPNKKSNGKTTKLEEEIEMFLQAYYQKLEEFDDLNEIDNDNIAYISLITLRGKLVTQDEFYKNYCSEQKLLKNLKKTDDYNIETQRCKNNCIDFYHIRTKNYKKPRDEDTIRIYINCNNGNVSELSRAILLYNNNPNLHLKFISSQQNYKLPRNEK